MIWLTLLTSSSCTPLRAAFFIDFKSASRFLDIKSIKNFNPFISPTYCSSMITLFFSSIFVFKIISCFNPLAKILIFLSMKLLVNSSCKRSDKLSSIVFVNWIQ